MSMLLRKSRLAGRRQILPLYFRTDTSVFVKMLKKSSAKYGMLRRVARPKWIPADTN
jgi:hypothetical protein